MLRRASLLLFLLAIGLAVACGRQVTPNPTFSNLAGTLEIKFRTNALANFMQYNYFIAVNTSGNGQEPYAVGFQNRQFSNFSYAVVQGVNSAATGSVLPILLQYYLIPNVQQPRTQQFNLNPATTQLQLNTATTSAYSEFIVIFARSQLSLPSPTGTSGPTPSASPSGKPTPTPTPSPTGTGPTPTPTPLPSGPTPVASPTIPSQSTWCINLFITDANGVNVYDALGLGAQDHSFNQGCFDVNTPLDRVYRQPLEVAPPPDPSSQLYGFELINTP
ncbi:MAG: hypothetical protein JO043_06480 [Candidatus Eremiobacteraeota bacterium]|nr:hypothetical protein [Candidatus Eremiobacteraeota bacterium]